MQAMDDLGIKSMALTDDDQAIIKRETSQAGPADQEAPQAGGGEDYLAELDKLADLRDRGIITDVDFEAKKELCWENQVNKVSTSVTLQTSN